jgi:tricorn protease
MGGTMPSIKLYDISEFEDGAKNVIAGIGGYVISSDGKKLLVQGPSGGAIVKAASGQSLAKPLDTSSMDSKINPAKEWAQLLRDAWRIQRDFFYDPNMHGVDWDKVLTHYAAMLPDCTTREDVSYLIGEMISELNVGHAYYFGGDEEEQPRISVGMLGADFALVEDENGDSAYRIEKIYEGATWDADARGPLSMHGVEVGVGDYLLAVNGVEIDTDVDVYFAFIGTNGKTTVLTVSDTAAFGSEQEREVVVKPMRSERNVRYRDWIETNRRYVEEMTDGKVGYIYVPDTGRNGQNDLFRQFYGQMAKEGIIIDERWNGGGQIPNRFIELMNRPRSNYWARRDGKDWPWPHDSHQGPKVMLINGAAGSGGDMFPWLFRKAGLGKIIGTRTWGGLVGISGNPGLIDGGYTSVPTFGFYETDGTWGIEGHGVEPDIEVIDDPALMVEDGNPMTPDDPQLDVAIQVVLEEIKLNPYVKPFRPAYPDRSGMGITDEDK